MVPDPHHRGILLDGYCAPDELEISGAKNSPPFGWIIDICPHPLADGGRVAVCADMGGMARYREIPGAIVRNRDNNSTGWWE